MTGQDDLNWHVALVSRPGLERLARIGLYARGFDVHVPIAFERLETKETKGRRYIIANRMLITPYFYVQFHTHDRDEHSLVLAERGVKHVLLASGRHDVSCEVCSKLPTADADSSFPSVVPTRLVRQSIAREYEEQHNATKKREGEDHGLLLGKEYKIIRGHGEGSIATLISVDRGEALLGHGYVLLRKSVFDILLVPEKKRAA
jgi:transcription antitermination factor NusG